jgi:hypothetical protein
MQLASLLLIFVTIFIFFLYLFAIASVASLVEFKDPVEKGSQHKVFEKPTGKVYGMIAFLTFGWMWITKFIGDNGKYITMVHTATYYFDSNETKDGSASVSTAFKFAYLKNAGSIAFGSLLLTVIAILKAMIDAAANSAKKEGDQAAACIACIAQCLIRCLEDLIE